MLVSSQLVAAGSGSIAGLTWSHNRGGQYIRARVIPVNPNTEAQGIARENMSTAVSLWTNTLTDAQRQAWATYAQDTPTVNRLGAQLILSGQAMFIRSVTSRLIAGLAAILDGPTQSGLGPTPQWVTDPVVDSGTQTVAGTTVSVEGAGVTGDLSVYVSRPVTASRTPAHQTRRQGFVEGPPVADVFTVSGPCPFAVSVNQRVRVTCVYLGDDGRVSAEAFRDVNVTSA
jgi:hypothetical protein